MAYSSKDDSQKSHWHWWIGMVIVPILVAIIGILPYWERERHHEEAEPPQSELFTLAPTGRVFDDMTRNPVSNARVSFDYQGVTHANQTDSVGEYRFTLKTSENPLQARMLVEAAGYEAFARNVMLTAQNGVLEPIYLNPSPAAPAPPSRAEIATPTPRIERPTRVPIPTPTPRPKPASKDWAALIVDDGGKVNRTLSSQIADLLRGQGKRVGSSPLFSGAFVSNGDFDRLFEGSPDDAARLETQAFFKYAIFGRRSVSFTQQGSELENALTATVTLELRVVEGKTGAIINSKSFEQNGAGFSKSKAEQAANERVLRDARGAIGQLAQ